MELIIKNRKNQIFTVLFDEVDAKLINSRNWYIGTDGYVRTVEAYPKLMHRLILEVNDSHKHVDHVNHFKLDNRRCNLRIATRSQNMSNRTAVGESKYLGVSHRRFVKKQNQYHYIIATIWKNGKKMFIGSYNTEEEAARAYDSAAIKIHGEFANLNFK